MESQLRLLAMSEEQLAALIDAAQRDVGLQEKLKGAADLDAVLAIAKEAGFDVSKAALLRYQAMMCLELSDEDLERVAAGRNATWYEILAAGVVVAGTWAAIISYAAPWFNYAGTTVLIK